MNSQTQSFSIVWHVVLLLLRWLAIGRWWLPGSTHDPHHASWECEPKVRSKPKVLCVGHCVSAHVVNPVRLLLEIGTKCKCGPVAYVRGKVFPVEPPQVWLVVEIRSKHDHRIEHHKSDDKDLPTDP